MDYKTVREYAQSIVETTLKDAGIMAITTSGIKESDCFREKVIQRSQEKHYQSAEE